MKRKKVKMSTNTINTKNKIKVVELFAGVGGFRLGLEGWHHKSASSGYNDEFESPYEIVWSNQWEPSTKTQHAYNAYVSHWGNKGVSNQDITTVDVGTIPDHDLLVGGFPCQDYSVATTLKNSKGLIGNKGVLWWSIYKILNEKKEKPKYLLFENVDRLLISPKTQRGRDFAIILQSLNQLGYAVEWRIINAAEYGMPQRRKRIFILGYHKTTSIFKHIQETHPREWILNKGTLANAFPLCKQPLILPSVFHLAGDIAGISSTFNEKNAASVFQNAGLMINGAVTTLKTTPCPKCAYQALQDIIINGEVEKGFFIDENSLDKWKYLKGAKKIIRNKPDGSEYHYDEGSIMFPDPLDKPSRTIITGEGGSSPSRFKHVIQTKNGLRRLMPIELERLNMFPDNHTKLEGISDVRRASFMGNALVVGIIEKAGIALAKKIKYEEQNSIENQTLLRAA
jgi:DNA (cytosine-5)-methyltransferase 1